MPKASVAVAMVLAVYIPPQEPGPGMAVFFNGNHFGFA